MYAFLPIVEQVERVWMDQGVCPGLLATEEYLSRPPIMSRLEVDEVLFAYIVVASHAVSLVIIWVDSDM